MDFTLKEVWRRTLCCLVSLVILQLLGDTVSVANGEFLHKNDTNISEDSTAAIMDKEAPEENNEETGMQNVLPRLGSQTRALY